MSSRASLAVPQNSKFGQKLVHEDQAPPKPPPQIDSSTSSEWSIGRTATSVRMVAARCTRRIAGFGTSDRFLIFAVGYRLSHSIRGKSYKEASRVAVRD